jgi:lipoprotein-releasing system ATP-binding protein
MSAPRAASAADARVTVPLVEARAVTRILPGLVPTTLVHDVTLAIGHNDFVAITGHSGSGKSSLLAMVEEERAFTRLSTIGFVFQFHFLLPEFTARENVMLPMRALARLSPRAMRERAAALLAALGLADHVDKRPDQLSGGQRQRVAVARALANEPPLILADEPTGSLDSKSSEQVFEILHELVQQRGKTVVAVTHDLEFARRMQRRIVLEDGGIASDDGAAA